MKKFLYQDLLNQRLTNQEAISTNRHPVSLILHNIRSMYNVGSIFRTCDSALAQEVILCGFTPFPPRKEIDKTALGATSSVPWTYEESILEAIKNQKSQGRKIAALELTNKSINYDKLSLSDFPLSIVLGNEISGVDDYILEECDFSIQIPMYGVKHSLNVGVATGIALFEAVKTWREINNLL